MGNEAIQGWHVMLPRSATKTLQSATASHRICEMLLPCSMGLSHRSSPMTLRLLSMYRSWHPHPFVFHGSERKPLTISVFEPRPTRNQTSESMPLVRIRSFCWKKGKSILAIGRRRENCHIIGCIFAFLARGKEWLEKRRPHIHWTG